MRWPFVRRSTAEALREQLQAAEKTVSDQQRALARQGHRVNQIYRETGQLVTDLRVVRFHVERQRSGPVRCMFELFDETLYHSFRRDGHLTQILAMQMEQALMAEWPGLRRGVLDDTRPPDLRALP